tara:strand:+ start:2136 stop:3833 length:1698 start_codon:yes stop_codon:yes gene_type:complete
MVRDIIDAHPSLTNRRLGVSSFEAVEYLYQVNPRLPTFMGKPGSLAVVPKGTPVNIPMVLTSQTRVLKRPALTALAHALNQSASAVPEASWDYSTTLSKSLGELEAFADQLKRRTATNPHGSMRRWGKETSDKVLSVAGKIRALGLRAAKDGVIVGYQKEGGTCLRCDQAEVVGKIAMAALIHALNLKTQAQLVPKLFGAADSGLGDAFERSWWSNLPLSTKAKAHTESLDVTGRDPLHLTRPLQVADWTHWNLAGTGRYRTTPLKGIVIHNTGGNEGSTSLTTLRDNGFSYHYIVDRDGTIMKLVDPHYRTVHAGRAGGNRFRNSREDPNSTTISISLANRGWVARDDGHTDMASWWARMKEENDERAGDDLPARWRLFNGHFLRGCAKRGGCTQEAIWETYPQAQVEAAARLSAYILERNDLDSGDIYLHEDLATPRGRKQDPGPVFPQSDFYFKVDDTQSALRGLGRRPQSSSVITVGGDGPSMGGPRQMHNCVEDKFVSKATGLPVCSEISDRDIWGIRPPLPWVSSTVVVSSLAVLVLGAAYVDLSRNRAALRQLEEEVE